MLPTKCDLSVNFSVYFTEIFRYNATVFFYSTFPGLIMGVSMKKEGRNTEMKELLYEFATLAMATAQAAGLVWITTVFVR